MIVVESSSYKLWRILKRGWGHQLKHYSKQNTNYQCPSMYKANTAHSHLLSAQLVTCTPDELAKDCSDSYQVLQTTSASQDEAGGELNVVQDVMIVKRYKGCVLLSLKILE